jgi:hypothetical protein
MTENNWIRIKLKKYFSEIHWGLLPIRGQRVGTLQRADREQVPDLVRPQPGMSDLGLRRDRRHHQLRTVGHRDLGLLRYDQRSQGSRVHHLRTVQILQ